MKRIALFLTSTVIAASAAASDPGKLTVDRYSPDEVATGPSDKFTGEARIESLFQAKPPARTGGGMVHFDAGARTAWHTHPLGQSLVITSGCGWVESEGDAVKAVTAGDTVWIPPDTRHWHGASAGQPMSHLAVSESVDGSSVSWMEHVSDETYSQGSDAEPVCD